MLHFLLREAGTDILRTWTFTVNYYPQLLIQVCYKAQQQKPTYHVVSVLLTLWRDTLFLLNCVLSPAPASKSWCCCKVHPPRIANISSTHLTHFSSFIFVAQVFHSHLERKDPFTLSIQVSENWPDYQLILPIYTRDLHQDHLPPPQQPHFLSDSLLLLVHLDSHHHQVLDQLLLMDFLQ